MPLNVFPVVDDLIQFNPVAILKLDFTCFLLSLALTVLPNLAAKLKLTQNFVFPGRTVGTTIDNFLIGKHKTTKIHKLFNVSWMRKLQRDHLTLK